MKKIGTLFIFGLIAVVLGFYTLASENYSNGERIGTITQFSSSGRFFKTHEGHLNVTQTGMNSGAGFDFSVDRDNMPAGIVERLDSAASNGWKVKIVYHEVRLYNWFRNRGNTDYFVNEVTILDRNFDNPFGNKNTGEANAVDINSNVSGRVIDTIYIVIVPGDKNYQKFFKTKNDTI